MPIIDSDAHVIEIDETWEYMDPSERHFKPGTSFKTMANGEVMKYWIIGGRAMRTSWPGTGANDQSFGLFIGNVGLPVESKFMLDVQARVRHMDEMGTDMQVLYPSLWTGPITTNPAEEVALCPQLQSLDGGHLCAGKGPLPLVGGDTDAGLGGGGASTAIQ